LIESWRQLSPSTQQEPVDIMALGRPALLFLALGIAWGADTLALRGGVRNGTSNATSDAAPAAKELTSREAADSARASAEVAGKVAARSINVTTHAQSALKRARGVLRDARADAQGLSEGQRELLKRAERQLHAAGQAAEYGKLKQAEYVKAKGHWKHSVNVTTETTIGRLENSISTSGGEKSEIRSMRNELETLHDNLEHKRRIITEHRHEAQEMNRSDIRMDDMSVAEIEQSIEELEEMLKQLEADEAAGKTTGSVSHDELKSELERLRIMIEQLEYREVLPLVEDEEGMRVRMRQLEELKGIRERMDEIDELLKVTADADTRNALQMEMKQLLKQEKILEEMLSFRPESPQSLKVEIDRLHKELGEIETIIPKKMVEKGELRITIPMKTIPVRLPIRELDF